MSLDNRELRFWDQFYTELERGLVKYTRPADWQERAAQSYEKLHKPVRNQHDGHTRTGKNFDGV